MSRALAATVGACFKINNTKSFVAAKITVIFVYYLTPKNLIT